MACHLFVGIELHHFELKYMQSKTTAIVSLSQRKEWISLLVYNAASTGIYIINKKTRAVF